MGVNDDSLNIIITAENDTAGAFAEAATGVDKLESSSNNLGETLKKAGSTMTSVGSTLTKDVTLPIVGIAAAATAMATKFQQSMEILHTEAGVPTKDLAALSTQILALAPQVGQSADALAEAMYHIESNGKGLLTTAQAMDELRVSAEAASMTGASLDDTTYALSSAMASGITGVKSYSEMMGVLNATVGTGDMKFQDLNGAIGTGFLATAAQFGISVQSMGAALATLTDNGVSAEEGATRLRMSIALMDAPSNQAAKVLGALGLSGQEVTAATQAATQALADAHVTTTKLAEDMRQPNGINVALEDLHNHLMASGLSANAADSAISKAFGGGRSDAAILTLLGNIDRTNEGFAMINKNSGDFASLWGDQQQTAAQKFKDAWAGVQSSLIELGTALLPVVVPMMQNLANAIQAAANWFNNLSPAMKQLLAAGVLFAALAGPLLVAVGATVAFVVAIAALGAPVLIVVGAVMLLAAAASVLVVYWGNITTFFSNMWSDIGKGFDNFKSGFEQKWDDLKNDWSRFWDAFGRVVDPFKQNLPKAVGEVLQNIGKKMEDYDLATLSSWGKYWDNVLKVTKDKLGALPNQVGGYLSTTVGNIGNWMNQVPGKVGNALGSIPQKFTDAFNGAGKAVGDFFTKLPETLKASVKSSGNTMGKNHADSFAEIWKNKSTTDKIGIAIVEGLGLVIASIYIFLFDMGVRMVESIQVGMGRASDKFGSLLTNAGSQLIQGLINGVHGMLGPLGHELSTVGSAITNNLKSALHTAHIPGFASGVQNFSGGLAIVGEQGPELVNLPGGSDVIPNSQLGSYGGGGTTNHQNVTIQQVVLQSAGAVDRFFSKLDQDTINISKGLTPTRGI